MINIWKITRKKLLKIKKSDKNGMLPSARVRQIVPKNRKKSDPFNHGYTQRHLGKKVRLPCRFPLWSNGFSLECFQNILESERLMEESPAFYLFILFFACWQ